MTTRRELIEQTRAAQRQRSLMVKADNPKSAIVGMGDRDPQTGLYQVLLSEGRTETGEKRFNSALSSGAQVLGIPKEVGGWTLDERDVVTDDTQIAIEEIPFKFILVGIRSIGQPYTFKVGGKTKEISFANRDRVDLLGRGEIDVTGHTSNRKLKLTFAATIDGTKPTDVSCVFNLPKPTKLQTIITCTSTVTAALSSDRDTGLPLTPVDMCNYLILNQVKLPALSYLTNLDATNFVSVSGALPATSKGFVSRSPGRYTGEKIRGTLPKATIASGSNGGFIFIFSPDKAFTQESYYSYKTTFEFKFR